MLAASSVVSAAELNITHYEIRVKMRYSQQPLCWFQEKKEVILFDAQFSVANGKESGGASKATGKSCRWFIAVATDFYFGLEPIVAAFLTLGSLPVRRSLLI